MEVRRLVKKWFDKWEEGDFLDLPISENFRHTSPFGTINGKEQYISLVKANKDKFLGYRFEIHDEIFDKLLPDFHSQFTSCELCFHIPENTD